MKRNAIARIIVYSLVALVLTGILCGTLVSNQFIFNFSSISGTQVHGEGNADAHITKNIHINWAAGNVVIKRQDVDQIIFRETSDKTIKNPMTYTWKDDTLTLNHSRASISFGINNPPEKDLVVIVPEDWKCDELEINGTALDIMLVDMSVQDLEVDGAGINLSITGYVYEMSVDGAGCTIYLDTSYITKHISIDGAGCKFTLILPEECGFRLDMDGLGCSFESDVTAAKQDGAYFFGNENCTIEIDGIGCHAGIYSGIYYSEHFPSVSE